MPLPFPFSRLLPNISSSEDPDHRFAPEAEFPASGLGMTGAGISSSESEMLMVNSELFDVGFSSFLMPTPAVAPRPATASSSDDRLTMTGVRRCRGLTTPTISTSASAGPVTSSSEEMTIPRLVDGNAVEDVPGVGAMAAASAVAAAGAGWAGFEFLTSSRTRTSSESDSVLMSEGTTSWE